MLEGLCNILIEQELKFKFRARSNQTEHEAFIADMILALEMGAFKLKEKSDSQMVVNQVTGENLTKYLHKVKIYQHALE